MNIPVLAWLLSIVVNNQVIEKKKILYRDKYLGWYIQAGHIYLAVGRHLFLHFELINIHSCLDFCPFNEILENLLLASNWEECRRVECLAHTANTVLENNSFNSKIAIFALSGHQIDVVSWTEEY